MNIFIAFANQDRDVRDKLLRQMNLVKDRQGWNIWSSKEIKAGERWDDEIKQRLMDSEVIVLLLSTDFFNSKYIIETELPKVVEKHRLGNCQIIPVIARVCHWKETTFGEYAELGDIQALPSGEKPITSKVHWGDEDQAYFEVVEGMKEGIRGFQAKKREGAANETESSQPVPKKTKGGLLVQLATIGVAGLAVLVGFLSTTLNAPLSVNQSPAIAISPDSLKKDTTKPAPIQQSKKDLMIPEKQPESKSAQPAFPFDYPMVGVTGGTFTMGSPATEEGRFDSECQHPVSVHSFWMGKYEVTQAQWKTVMGKNPSVHKDCDDCPVENVSWNDVQEFIKALNKKTGRTYRLPTETEWEYAAKGGVKSQSYTYAGGNDLGSLAWHSGNSGSKTHPAGGKSPNELGLYDMSGNVWEWCQDSWKPYSCDSKTTVDGRGRVHRGGGALYGASRCRTASRVTYGAAHRLTNVGFRLAHD